MGHNKWPLPGKLLKKLAAVYAYACNRSTPSKVDVQEKSTYDMIHGLNGCAPVLKIFVKGLANSIDFMKNMQ